MVTLLFSLIGCSDDLYHQGSAPVTKNKTVSIEEFKRKTGLQNFSKTFKIPKNNNLAYRKADGSYELSDFDINFDYIKQVVVEDKVSYTFNIEPKIITSKSIFNLVVYNHDGNWETSILELIPTEENFDKLLSGLDNKFTGNVKQVYSARIPGNCYTVAFFENRCYYKNTDECRITCDRCSLCFQFVRYNICNDTEIMQPIYPISVSGGGAASGLIDPSGYIFDPNLYELGSPKYEHAKNAAIFWNDLSDSQQQWADTNPQEYNQVIQYQIQNNWSNESKDFANEYITSKNKRVCLSSFSFSDVGSNWQNAGVSNVGITFVTIGATSMIVHIQFSELHFGFPKELINGDYITNNNARYKAQTIMTQAEALTNAYQSINPTSTVIQLRNYFYNKLQDGMAEYGGTISTAAPLGWTGTVKEHQTYFLSSGIECD